ncbi:hypothetical protein GDO81_025281 [Engystomops pustulosus]|uniref:POU domain protein n=1 Tax=Engystomops pustulosus TaxID=76066 RepID=A0AAV6Z0U9_ENGPU|nr:hypothetical protein GDO81_025281 [Engystomops pustulosus]
MITLGEGHRGVNSPCRHSTWSWYLDLWSRTLDLRDLLITSFCSCFHSSSLGIMYSQQGYPAFALNPSLMQDTFGGYHHPSQPFFFSAVKPDNGEHGGQPLGEPSPQVMAWSSHPGMEPPGPLNVHQVREETPGAGDKVKVKEERQEDDKTEEKCLQYYPNFWGHSFWPGPHTNIPQKNHNLPGPSNYPTTSRSPNTPGEPATSNMESSRCSSAPAQEAAKDGGAAVNLTVSSPRPREEAQSSDGEEVVELPSESEMEQFAREMKHKRVSMGFTQADVGYALGVLYGKMFSQTTICRFESLQLSFKNMCQLKPLLQRWLQEAEHNDNLQEMINREQALAQSRKRKRRTNIENIVKDSLETYYMKNQKPGAPDMAQIARELQMDKDVVRVWFCNRRQKDKRQVPGKDHGAEPFEMQHLVHPHMGSFPAPQEMTPQGYMPPHLGAPSNLYPPAYKNDLFPQPGPNGMQHGNQN